MPVYEYQCIKCGTVQERFFQSNLEQTVHCEECDGPCVRIISQTFPPRGFGESAIDRVNKNWDKTPGLGKKGP